MMRLPDALAEMVRPFPAEPDVGRGLKLYTATARETLWKAPPGATVSRSAAGDTCGLLIAPAGREGLDIETLDRVVFNAAPDDDWLTPREKACVAAALNPVALACRWVLKEACSKALGLGLALPFEQLSFGARGSSIVVEGPDAPSPLEEWTFRLYRRGEMLFGIAWGPPPSEGDAVRSGGKESARTLAGQI